MTRLKVALKGVLVTACCFVPAITLATTFTVFAPPPEWMGPAGCNDNVDGCAFTNISSGSSAAQTFTSGMNGRLESFRLFGDHQNQGNGNVLEVSVVRMANDAPSDNPTDLLGRVTIPMNQLPSEFPGDWFQVDFSGQAIELVEGTQYAIVLAKPEFDMGNAIWWGSGKDKYAGGEFFSKNAPQNIWGRFPVGVGIGDFTMQYTVAELPEANRSTLMATGAIFFAAVAYIRRRRQPYEIEATLSAVTPYLVDPHRETLWPSHSGVGRVRQSVR